MRFFKKIYGLFHEDCCTKCQTTMKLTKKQLFMLNITVGHYRSHKDPEYYKKNLIKVKRKADIPAGMYACGIKSYQCPKCGHQPVYLSIFLPVRDQEKYEDTIYFENGELDSFLNDNSEY